MLGGCVRIEKFTLCDRKIERKLYAGTVTGEDLQLIEKTGWNAKHGYPVQGIPTPVASDPAQQTLDIALPWPPPNPQAPLYIWVRGETEARRRIPAISRTPTISFRVLR